MQNLGTTPGLRNVYAPKSDNSGVLVRMYETLRFDVGLTAGRYNFPQSPQLRNQADQIIIIKSLETFIDEDTDNAASTLVDAADAKVLSITLVSNGWEAIKSVPYLRFRPQVSATGSSPVDLISFDNLTNVDFDKSYIEVLDTITKNSLVIGINYVRLMRQ